MPRNAADSKVLEVNTAYCYGAFALHFGTDGCVIAERGGKPVGYIQGYRPPTHPDTVFVWQIGVDASERGRGLGKRLLRSLCARLAGDRGVKYLEATVTPSTEPSRALFRGFARDIGAACEEKPLFKEDDFPKPAEGAPPHEPEDLFRIGPFSPETLATAAETAPKARL